ncbi:hypothetical protein CHX26_10770 [Porphyrobacter sp. HT-58-2]|nr:hypothetical protein CHX26_10770 [Porphyrobacter sp. HT-58-2]
MPQRSMVPSGPQDHGALDSVRQAVCIEILHESDKEPAVRSFIREATGLVAALSLLGLPMAPAAATQAAPDDAAPAPVCRTIHAVRQQPGAVVLPVQDYEPAPALWKLSDEDTTIYIFGTFHILPEGFRWRTALLDKLIAETDEVVFESVEEPRADDATPTAEEVAFAALFEQFRSDIPLSQRIAERNRGKLQRMLDLAGVTLADVERARRTGHAVCHLAGEFGSRRLAAQPRGRNSDRAGIPGHWPPRHRDRGSGGGDGQAVHHR